MQAIGTVMSQNPKHILHIAHVFLHKASHIINRCDKTSTLTPFVLILTPYNPVIWLFTHSCRYIFLFSVTIVEIGGKSLSEGSYGRWV